MVYDQTQELFTATGKVVELNKMRTKHDLKFVKGQVTDCANLLKSSWHNLNAKTSVKCLVLLPWICTEGAIEVGFWVELVAIYHYRVEQSYPSGKIASGDDCQIKMMNHISHSTCIVQWSGICTVD